MNNQIEVKFVQDESCHWYMIPVNLEYRFDDLLENEDVDTLNNEFYQYRTHDSPSVISTFVNRFQFAFFKVGFDYVEFIEQLFEFRDGDGYERNVSNLDNMKKKLSMYQLMKPYKTEPALPYIKGFTEKSGRMLVITFNNGKDVNIYEDKTQEE